jgi:hypothetical protein
MKKSIVKETVNYLFLDLTLLFDILRQNSCRKIETSQDKYFKVIGGFKEIFLKNLSKALFIGSTRIDRDNTILINVCPLKCVCNEIGNCLFLQTWTCHALSDDFFLHALAL